MKKVLLVAQETGGVGKSTVTRGLAEAVENVSIYEVESNHRLTEFDHGKKANERKLVRHFPMRASRKEIEETGGVAARAELDLVLNAIADDPEPALVDIGANTSASLLELLGAEAEGLKEAGVEFGVVVVVAAEAGSLADAGKLLRAVKPWAAVRFVVANEVRGRVDPDILKRVADGATVTTLRRFDFEEATLPVLKAGQLRGIGQLNLEALKRQHGFAQAGRIARDLKGFRLAVMEAVKPAAIWFVS